MAIKARRLLILVGVPVLVAGGIVFAGRDLLFPPITLVEGIPSIVSSVQPEIESAKVAHVKKGNKYIWGANDCSIFVMDYIKACGKGVPFRPTTQTLMNPIATQAMGFSQTSSTPKTGDILVYRYQNSKNEWRGHTGVVVWYKDSLWVAHNTLTHNGLVVQRLDKFDEQAHRLTKGKDTSYKTLRRNDYESWYASFKKRREQAL